MELDVHVIIIYPSDRFTFLPHKYTRKQRSWRLHAQEVGSDISSWCTVTQRRSKWARELET